MALLVTAVYLGAKRPHTIVPWYLAGAVISCVGWGLVVLVVLRAGHLDYQSEQTPRYGLRATLGLLMLATAGVTAARKPRSLREGKNGDLVGRLTFVPSRVSALKTGMVVFLPSLTFIAAVQVIGTASAGTRASVLGLVVVAGITAACVWLPFAAYLLSPGRTAGRFRTLNAFLTAHGRYVLIVGLCVAGLVLTVNGVTGLTG
jgi:hypothetical protein